MSALTDRIKDHLTAQPRKRLVVPEWGTGKKPLVVTFTTLTARDRQKIYRPDDRGRPADGATVQVRAVMFNACDDEGKRLFDEMDQHVLMYEADHDVVARIAAAILYDAGLATEDGVAVGVEDQKDKAKNG